ncbi:MAG: hypothetical protein K1X74_19815 [Pirellulales bacterium]|nr:hypothetical protein [Pirellulales bacterium]
MPKVSFYGGPYDGKEADLPFLPDVLIGETMDGDFGDTVIDLRVSTYVYKLAHPNGSDEPYEYIYLRERPKLEEWFRDPPKP